MKLNEPFVEPLAEARFGKRTRILRISSGKYREDERVR
jgi:hypothetical protein